MNEGQEKKREETLRRSRKVSREEQGDLLADAVTGFFAFQGEDGPAKEASKEPETGRAPESAPKEGSSASPEDSGPIRASPGRAGNRPGIRLRTRAAYVGG